MWKRKKYIIGLCATLAWIPIYTSALVQSVSNQSVHVQKVSVQKVSVQSVWAKVSQSKSESGPKWHTAKYTTFK